MTSSRPRAFVIDDNESILSLLATVLEFRGFEVQTAPNGARALELLQSNPAFSPDVILVDMAMPLMDGPTFVEVYRRRTEALNGRARVPILGVTATPWLAVPVAEQLDGVLVKPFRVAELVERLNGVLAMRRNPEHALAGGGPAK